MTEETAERIINEKYGFLSEFLISNKALLMGGPVLAALQDFRPKDIDICIPKKYAVQLLNQEGRKRDMLITRRSSRYAHLYYLNRCIHLHYNKNPHHFFEYRRALFWDGKQFRSVLPINDVLAAISENKIIFTKKYKEVNINLTMLRVKRESEVLGSIYMPI